MAIKLEQIAGALFTNTRQRVHWKLFRPEQFSDKICLCTFARFHDQSVIQTVSKTLSTRKFLVSRRAQPNSSSGIDTEGRLLRRPASSTVFHSKTSEKIFSEKCFDRKPSCPWIKRSSAQQNFCYTKDRLISLTWFKLLELFITF